MRRIVTSLCVALLIAILVPVAFTAAAINQHYTGEVASVNDFQILITSEIVALGGWNEPHLFLQRAAKYVEMLGHR